MIAAWLFAFSMLFMFIGSTMLLWPRLLASALIALNRTPSRTDVSARRRPFLGVALLSLGLALCIYTVAALSRTIITGPSKPDATARTSASQSPQTPGIAGGAIQLLIDPGFMYKLRDSFAHYRDKWDQTPWPRRNARIVGAVILVM